MGVPRSLTGAIDTATPADGRVFHLFADLGQFEHDPIQERTRAVLTAAAARGRTGERKPPVTDDKHHRTRAHHQRTDRAQGGHAREGRQGAPEALRTEPAYSSAPLAPPYTSR